MKKSELLAAISLNYVKRKNNLLLALFGLVLSFVFGGILIFVPSMRHWPWIVAFALAQWDVIIFMIFFVYHKCKNKKLIAQFLVITYNEKRIDDGIEPFEKDEYRDDMINSDIFKKVDEINVSFLAKMFDWKIFVGHVERFHSQYYIEVIFSGTMISFPWPSDKKFLISVKRVNFAKNLKRVAMDIKGPITMGNCYMENKECICPVDIKKTLTDLQLSFENNAVGLYVINNNIHIFSNSFIIGKLNFCKKGEIDNYALKQIINRLEEKIEKIREFVEDFKRLAEINE